ncbi:MAG: T9SS type A sorting domain-containing protein [Bacteroidetes bacterium]|nr:T9SS type A sorting domain-containing protein [Bacteroidota bacterium]
MRCRIARRFIFFSILISCSLSAQLSRSGSLTAYVDSLITAIPDATPSNLYQIPSAGEADLWSAIASNMLKGDQAAAHADAGTIGYDIVNFTDTTNSKTYAVLRKQSAGTNYWGTLLIDPSPLRSRLFIQAPHPLHDANTGNQAIVVFKNTGARAFILAGTHRCNSTALSSCDGTTSVCGGSNQFRKSDQAHTDDGPFQITTSLFKRLVPNLIVLQLHGFVKDPGYPDLILGNGTQAAPAADWLTRFKNELTVLDGTLQFKLAHVDTSWTTLTGTTNSQGRLINNSPDPCGIAAAIPNGRFLHIEQAYTGLRNGAVSYAKVASAVANTFPPDKMTASAMTGNWESASTWTGSTVPNDTTHVVISSGHTVTVTTGTAEARSLVFADNTAHLSLTAGADLSLYGDLSLASGSHAAFSSWASGAEITFAGDADQTVGGWNKDSTGFSTSLMEMVVDKSSGTLSTDGSEMNLTIGNRLEVVDGAFVLTAGDDIEGRDLAGNATTPEIIVRSGGVLTVQGDTSYIRSGTADTAAIGRLRNAGTVRLYGTDISIGYNFSDVYNEDGGIIEVFTGWRSSRLLRADTLLLNAGSVFTTSTTTNILTSAGRTVLNAGATYRILGSGVNFSSFMTNNGTVEYASDDAQTVSDRTYKKVRFSNAGTKSWTLTANRTADTIELSGTASLSLSSASPYILTASQLLSMSGGNITTGTNSVAIGTSAAQRGALVHSAGSVVGPLKRYLAAATVNDLHFPVGTAAASRSMWLDATSAPAAGSLTARFFESDPGIAGLPLDDAGYTVTNAATEGYWSLTTGDGLSGGTFSLDVGAQGFSGINTVTSLRLMTRPNAGSWSLAGAHAAGSGTTAAPIISRTGVSLPGEFGVGAGEENPLPVVLTGFSAVIVRSGVELRWSTAGEVDNFEFVVERMELKGSNDQSWRTIGSVPGQGTTNTTGIYSYVDPTAKGAVRYRLKQVDRNGSFAYSEEVFISVHAPKDFTLDQNFPNPFNPVTTFTFSLPQTAHTTLSVYSMIGQQVATIVNEVREGGVIHQVQFDARHLPSGAYIARLTSQTNTMLRRIVLMK